MKDEAVSPVIGVILLVAITFVVAGLVFVLAKTFNETRDVAPYMTVHKDATARTLTVITVGNIYDWFDNIRIEGTCDPILNGSPYPTTSGTPVSAGDRLSCEQGETIRISSKANAGNALLYETEFA